MTHDTVAVGPAGPGRHRIVAATADTKDGVFRRVTDDEDVLRIAAEAGVSREAIGGETCLMDAVVPDRAPEAVPDRAPEAVPDRAPEAEPDRAPEAEPDRTPEPVPDRAPEPVPDRA